MGGTAAGGAALRLATPTTIPAPSRQNKRAGRGCRLPLACSFACSASRAAGARPAGPDRHPGPQVGERDGAGRPGEERGRLVAPARPTAALEPAEGLRPALARLRAGWAPAAVRAAEPEGEAAAAAAGRAREERRREGRAGALPPADCGAGVPVAQPRVCLAEGGIGGWAPTLQCL